MSYPNGEDVLAHLDHQLETEMDPKIRKMLVEMRKHEPTINLADDNPELQAALERSRHIDDENEDEDEDEDEPVADNWLDVFLIWSATDTSKSPFHTLFKGLLIAIGFGLLVMIALSALGLMFAAYNALVRM